MKEIKIFKPDIMLDNTIKSCWTNNVKTTNNKLSINEFLKNKGIFALDIYPIATEYIYAFGLPVNRNWEPETFTEDVFISFSIYAKHPMDLMVAFQDSDSKSSPAEKIKIDIKDIDSWKEIKIPITVKDKLRLIIFSGSAQNTPNYVIKDIIITT